MTFFAEKMKALTDGIFSCTQERASALAELNEHTERLLGDARSFVKDLDEEHQARATQVRSTLATHRRDCMEQAKVFRQNCFQKFNDMRTRLHEMLSTNQNARNEKLKELREGFRETQQELAGDLQEAGRIWRSRSGSSPESGKGFRTKQKAASRSRTK